MPASSKASRAASCWESVKVRTRARAHAGARIVAVLGPGAAARPAEHRCAGEGLAAIA